MMRYDPTLIVTRVVIERDSLVVYDERFHRGVNVIRGDNSSGKSTVLNFIYYGLGGDLADWSTAARLCSRVIVEVRLNGNLATLSREISDKAGQPMDIFGGSLEDSQRAPRADWLRYPYRGGGNGNRESFSQAIFRLLKIPEVASDQSGNITMNQILRLLYADQLSPIEDIFKFQRFDDANLRETVGRLLCGAYDSALYDNIQKLKALSKEFDSISGELKSLFSVLGKSEQGISIEWIETEKNALEEKRRTLQSSIEETEQKLYVSAAHEHLTKKFQEKAYREVQLLQVEIGVVRRDRDALVLTIADSTAFIRNLEHKIEALRDSSSVVEHLGEVEFQSCPSCYAPIEGGLSHACNLCKVPFNSEETQTRIISLINDTALQVKQSQFLQSRREARLRELSEHVQKLERQWQHASRHLVSQERLLSTDSLEELRELHRQSGYIERQIEDLDQKMHIAQLVQEISDRKSNINSEINRFRSENEKLEAEQQERLSKAYTAISEKVKSLLINDLRRQDIFENPRRVDFTFSGNKISVDGENYFSASSRAILKSSFYLAFLAAATEMPFFRHPRFCMIDTLENMGVESIRSHNFQLQIARISAESKVEHQIIYATAMIEPSLDDENITIGKHSTLDSLTIDVSVD
jgi:hypothetical protein